MVIHIVEDDLAVSDSLSEFLNAIGHDVAIYNDGGSFLANARVADTDTVIIDLALPDMNGSQIVRWLQSAHPRTRTIVVSGQSKKAITRALADVEVGIVMRKPLSVDLLADTIAQTS